MVNVIFSSNWLIERIKIFLEREDITHQQYNILRILKGHGTPLSTLQIRERMIDKMSDTSRIVERLLKKHLADKVVCTKDKRLVDVTITEKGMDVLARLDVNISEMDSLAAGLNMEEAQTLNELLDKMREKATATSLM